ncbi:MAG: HAD family hydrolase [Kiritimatiellia bacterium]
MKNDLPQPLSRYDLVVWDWNGTLLDDAWLCRDGINLLLHRRGLPLLSPHRYMEIFDFPIIEYYRKAGFDLQREPFERLGLEFIEDYHARRPECRLQPGAAEVLARLESLGIAQAVLSASEHASLEQALAHFGIRDHFQRVLGIEDHYAAGKELQGRRLMEELRPDPARVLLIGDTRHDHEVASAMAVDCILIPSGNHTRERLAQTGRPVFDSLERLAEALEG